MTKTYVRLSLEEREEISRGLACGEYLSDIAKRIHRNETLRRKADGVSAARATHSTSAGEVLNILFLYLGFVRTA